MKCKVKVIAISLNRNKVAKLGEIIDSSQLPNPDNVEQLIKNGYLEKYKLSKKDKVAEIEVIEPEVVETEAEITYLNEEQLKGLTKSQIKEYAIENGIDFDADSNKKDLIAEVLSNSDKKD